MTLTFFAVIPNDKLFLLICLCANAFSMLLTIQEFSFVFSPVWPTVDTISMLFTFTIGALVSSPVRPLEHALAMH